MIQGLPLGPPEWHLVCLEPRVLSESHLDDISTDEEEQGKFFCWVCELRSERLRRDVCGWRVGHGTESVRTSGSISYGFLT